MFNACGRMIPPSILPHVSRAFNYPVLGTLRGSPGSPTIMETFPPPCSTCADSLPKEMSFGAVHGFFGSVCEASLVVF